MKKYINIIILPVTVVLTVIGSVSCSKEFLEEDLKTKRKDTYYNTADGIKAAVNALYYRFRDPFTFEQCYSTTQYGTDEFTVGGDNSNHDWNDYTANLGPMVVRINVNTTYTSCIWDSMYRAIGSANLVLANVDAAVTDSASKALYKAEASFSRAFSYFKLVQQYGGVVLTLKPATGVEKYFVRSSKEECLNQIVADFRVAYAGLPSAEPKEGKLYKDVAAHFLAKALLYRASEINDDWNASYKEADLAECITLCDYVIPRHALASNFRDLFAFTVSDGPNEKLPEVIFAAQFSNANTAVEGNRQHLYFPAQYNNLTGFTRDIAGGREYQRLRTSGYMYDIYDLVNDSRFWKSFRTKLNLNNKSTAGQLKGKDTVTNTYYSYSRGDLGIIYVINDKNDLRFVKNRAKVITDSAKKTSSHTGVFYLNPFTGKPTPHTYVRYFSDGTEHLRAASGVTNRFPSCSKWYDGSRPNHNYETGCRDGLLARVAETYLIKAEALIKLHRYDEALTVINTVRNRAAFKSGEDRATYTDGGAAYLTNAIGQASYADGILVNSFEDSNSYYESNNIPNTTDATNLTATSPSALPAVDEAIIAKLGYTSEYDRMMCFLLNERSRELVGEFHRWEDLARTKTLIARVKAFNPEGAPNITDKHYLRPIPQTFLDAIYNEEGRALTADEKQAMQNPGY